MEGKRKENVQQFPVMIPETGPQLTNSASLQILRSRADTMVLAMSTTIETENFILGSGKWEVCVLEEGGIYCAGCCFDMQKSTDGELNDGVEFGMALYLFLLL